MATATRTTTTYPTNATGTTNFRTTYTDPLREAFVAGEIIRTSDMDLLRTAITTFNNHTHSVRDYRSIGNFGNNGPRTVIASPDPRTSSSMSGASTPTNVAVGNTITATIFNTYRTAVNAARSHTHTIDDNDTA